MSTDQLDVLFAWRTRLQDLGLMADDLADAQVLREARLREMVARLRDCRMSPGTWEKRFVKDVDTSPGLLTEKQEKAIRSLWTKYRAQLRRRRANGTRTGYFTPMAGMAWPDWLPPIPEKC